MAPMPHRFAQPERTYAVKPKYKVSRSLIVLFMGLSLMQIYYKKTPLLTGFLFILPQGQLTHLLRLTVEVRFLGH